MVLSEDKAFNPKDRKHAYNPLGAWSFPRDRAFNPKDRKHAYRR